MRLSDRETRLESTFENGMKQKKNHLEKLCASLGALNPLGVLSRGYAAVYRGNETVTKAAEVHPDDALSIRFADGSIPVRAMEKGDKNG